ncbi:7576_t:CDS:2, partial [Racocetra persica]
IYGTQEKNLLYEALSWIISQQIKELDKDSFIVQPTNSKKYESNKIPDFNILPEKKQQVNIQYRGRTRKTSLINAISSYLSRDIYYINLKDFKNDNEMSVAFSSVPPNQIIVLEDVDTQSNVLYKRGGHPNYCSFISEDEIKEKDDLSKFKNLLSFISLSKFLKCLDRQMLSEGTIIIMTMNHIEQLDPICIRPGRIDVYLNLEYCTHQIRKMFQKVIKDPDVEFLSDIIKKIPE